MTTQNKTQPTEVIDELNGANRTVGFNQNLLVKRAVDSSFVVKSGGQLTIEESQNCKIFYGASAKIELKNDNGSLQQEV